MPAVKADYYAVLGVPRDADEETIRHAFHALADDCHPDVSDAPEDHRRFRELAEAYDVLVEAVVPAPLRQVRLPGARQPGAFPAGRGRRARHAGDDVRAGIELEAYEALRGARKLIRYEADTECPSCEGVGVLGEPDPECPNARDRPDPRDLRGGRCSRPPDGAVRGVRAHGL